MRARVYIYNVRAYARDTNRIIFIENRYFAKNVNRIWLDRKILLLLQSNID